MLYASTFGVSLGKLVRALVNWRVDGSSAMVSRKRADLDPCRGVDVRVSTLDAGRVPASNLVAVLVFWWI